MSRAASVAPGPPSLGRSRARRDGIVIAGAGLAGLSVAVHLVERGVRHPITLLDPRADHAQSDRTWCYWRHDATPFDACVSHRWSAWSVAQGAVRHRSSSVRHPYECIHAADFYAFALDRLRASGNVRLAYDTEVSALSPRVGGVEVETSRGALAADLVFDSRPSTRFAGGLQQAFVGLQVRTAPVFDPGEVYLMHFRPAVETDRARFLYVLPFSRTEALVEATTIERAERGTTFGELRDDALEYLRATWGVSAFELRREEQGRIPMQVVPSRQPAGRHVRIGIAGGMVRPSTGYAFHTVQERAAQIAEQVLAGADAVRVSGFRPRTAWLDRIFLRYLEGHLAEAPSLFLAMFGGTKGDTQARFLSDRGTAADEFAVIRALPKRGLVAEAVRNVVAGSQAA